MKIKKILLAALIVLTMCAVCSVAVLAVTVTNVPDLLSATKNASSGEIITLKNGTYELTERLVIDKNITLIGESRDGVIIKPANTFTVSTQALGASFNGGSHTLQPIIYVKSDASNVTIDSLTISGPFTGNLYSSGIVSACANFSITNVTVADIYNGIIDGVQNGRAIVIIGGNADITNCEISNFNKSAIQMHSSGVLNVIGCTITGPTDTSSGRNGIFIAYGTVNIRENTISINGYSGNPSGGQGSGVLVGYGSNIEVVIENNTISNNNVAVAQSNANGTSTVTASSNTIKNVGTAFETSGSESTLLAVGNELTNCNIGFNAQSGSNIIESGNTCTNCTKVTNETNGTIISNTSIPSSFTFSSNPIYVTVGGSAMASVSTIEYTGTNQNYTYSATWSTNDTNISVNSTTGVIMSDGTVGTATVLCTIQFTIPNVGTMTLTNNLNVIISNTYTNTNDTYNWYWALLPSIIPGVGETSSPASFGNAKIEIESFIFDKYTQKDINLKITLNGNKLLNVKIDGKRLSKGSDYSVTDDILTIYASALSNFALGENEVVLSFDSGKDITLTAKIVNSFYNDMPKSHWGYTEIKEAFETKIISLGNGNFYPNALTTRFEYIEWIVNAFNLKKIDDSTPDFEDFSELSSEMKEIVTIAWQNGILKGTSDSEGYLYIDGSANLTREQFAVVLARAKLGTDAEAQLEQMKKNGELSLEKQFHDIGKVSSWAELHILYAIKNGWIKGDDTGMLYPLSSINKAQAVVMIMRAK